MGWQGCEKVLVEGMDLFVDTANLDEIGAAFELGILSGVTTNPSLIAREGGDRLDHLRKICAIVEGPVSAQVVAEDCAGMLSEAEGIVAVGEQMVVKLPCTLEGLKACKALSDRGVRTNMTLCFQPLQALLAAKAGAYLVSPFVGRVDDAGGDGVGLIRDIRAIYDQYGFETRVLCASVRGRKPMIDVAKAGADIVTAPLAQIRDMMAHPLTDSGLAQFLADYRKASGA